MSTAPSASGGPPPIPGSTAPAPLDAFETAFQTARLTLRRLLRGKRWILAVILVALPCAIAALAAAIAKTPERGLEAFYGILSFLHFGIGVPGVALTFATSFPWTEADEGSLVWWFSAPVKRSAIHAGRYAATLLFGLVLLPLAVVLLALPLNVPETAQLQSVVIAAAAATVVAFPAYLGLFWLATTLTRRGLVIGIIFVIVENFLSLSQGNLARLTVIHYVRGFLVQSIPEASIRAAEPILQGTAGLSRGSVIAVLGSTAVLTVGLSLLLVSRIEYRGKTSQAN